MTYSLLNHQEQFDVNENTGQIYTVSVVGYSGPIFLGLQAADQGGLTAHTTVNVRKNAIYSPNFLLCQNSMK